MTTLKAVLLIFGMLLSAFIYSIAFAIIACMITGARAIAWPALKFSPQYWLFMILLLGSEAWLAVHRMKW